MNAEQITTILSETFGANAVTHPTPDSWQVDTSSIRLLVLLSQDNSWLRLLVPLVSAKEAQPFWEQLLEANFDFTQEIRYALSQDVLWGVFFHHFESLTARDLKSALASMAILHETGLSHCFNQSIEKRLRQIVKAAKHQGQSLEATLQTLDRFYHEGILGGLQQDPREKEKFMAAWQYQLQRLWSEIELPD